MRVEELAKLVQISSLQCFLDPLAKFLRAMHAVEHHRIGAQSIVLLCLKDVTAAPLEPCEEEKGIPLQLLGIGDRHLQRTHADLAVRVDFQTREPAETRQV